MKKIFIKVKKAIIEKRFLRTLIKKIYPYIKGFILFFVPSKNDIKILIPRNNIIDKKDIHLVEKIFNFYKKMKIDQKKLLRFISLRLFGKVI